MDHARGPHMGEVIARYRFIYPDSDQKVVDVIWVGDAKYPDGIKYDFTYLKYAESSGEYARVLAVDNSHGKPHMHYAGLEKEVDWNWKQSFNDFKKMVSEYRKTRSK